MLEDLIGDTMTAECFRLKLVAQCNPSCCVLLSLDSREAGQRDKAIFTHVSQAY